MRGFIPPTNDEERLFCRRVEDAVRFVTARGILRVLPFCSDREQSLAQAVLAKQQALHTMFFGGYADAERKMLALSHSEITADDFPLQALVLTPCAQNEAPGHRDYLGALLSLRIGRELLGDIVLLPPGAVSGAVLFAHERAAALVHEELLTVGRTAVRVSYAQQDVLCALENRPDRPLCTGTLPSLRLDAMLSAMLRVSRTTAAELIRAKAVMVNHIETTSCHSEVCAGDVFTVRGKGRFRLCDIGGQSKKDRIFVSWMQY